MIAREFEIVNECADPLAYVDISKVTFRNNEQMDTANTIFAIGIAACAYVGFELFFLCCCGCLAAITGGSICKRGNNCEYAWSKELPFFMKLLSKG